MTQVVRAGWGFTLLMWPATVLHRLEVEADGRSCAVARVLGCRHIVQATVLLLWPMRAVQLAGAGVDVFHGASMAGLALLDPMRGKAALTSAVDAAVWATLATLFMRNKQRTRRFGLHPAWTMPCMST